VDQVDIETFKADIHRTLISKLDLEKLSRVNSSQARQAVAGMINEITVAQRVPLSLVEQERVQSDLLDEVFRLGPLEPLLADPTISDIAQELDDIGEEFGCAINTLDQLPGGGGVSR